MFPYNPKHNPNVSCAFYAGYIGNSTEDYFVFKNKVQELINQDIRSFTKEKPSVKNNMFPNHGGPTATAVLEEEETYVVSLMGD